MGSDARRRRCWSPRAPTSSSRRDRRSRSTRPSRRSGTSPSGWPPTMPTLSPPPGLSKQPATAFGRLDGAVISVGGPPAGPDLRAPRGGMARRIRLRLPRRAAPGHHGRRGALRGRLDRIHPLVVGPGADPEPRHLQRPASRPRHGGQDARRRAGPARHPRQRAAPGSRRHRARPGARRALRRRSRAKEKHLATIPLGRYGDPAEFGRAAAFCLSPAASYVSGVMLPVDGGLIRAL